MRRGRRVRSFSDSESVEPPDLSDTEDSSLSEASDRSFIITYIFYLIVGICTNLIGKQLLTFFPFTKTVTMVQLFCTFIFSIPACTMLGIPLKPAREIWSYKVFLAICGLTVGKFTFSFATQQSMRANAVSFTHTVKSLMPIFTVFFERLLSRPHSLLVYCSLIPIVSGVTIASYTEVQFTWIGLAWAVTATGVFSMQNIGSKMLMDKTRIHTLQLLYILAGLSSLVFFNIWLYSDWSHFKTATQPLSKRPMPVTFLYLFGDGFCNFLQNLLAFRMIGMVSPLTYSVFNVLKRLIVIAASIAFFNNPVTGANVFGIFLAVGGVWGYNRAKIRELKLRRRKPMLPLTRSDMKSNHGNFPAANGHVGSLPGVNRHSVDDGSKAHALTAIGESSFQSPFLPSYQNLGNQQPPFQLMVQR